MAKAYKTKYTMRSPKEKEAIVLEAFKNGIAKTWNKYNINESTLYDWIKKYKKDGLNGLKSQTGKSKHPGRGNPLCALIRKKNLTHEEELELENLKLKIEVARLKKGYQVKGVGQKKVYVTIKNSNMKS